MSEVLANRLVITQRLPALVTRRPSVAKVILAAVLAALVVSFALYSQDRFDARQARFRSLDGNLSDLYPSWLASKFFLQEGRDPYSAEVTARIQLGFYGRVLSPDDPVEDQQAFAYPLYAAFIWAPFTALPFDLASWLFEGVMVLLLLLGLLAWLDDLGWRAQPRTKAILLAACFLFFPLIQALGVQQPSLLTFGLLLITVRLLRQGRLFAAGLILALAMVKPQLLLVLLLGLILWTLGAWKHRRVLWVGFGTGIAVLMSGAELLLPGWFAGFIRALGEYRGYIPLHSSLEFIFPNTWLVVGLSAVVLLVTPGLWWRIRRVQADSPAFRLALAMTIAASITVIPDVGLYNKSFLLMPLLLLWRYRHEVSSLSGLSLARCLHRVTIACIVVAFVTAGASAIACRTMPSWPVVIGMQILPFMLYLYLPPLVFAALIPLAKKRCFGNNIGASTFVLPLLSY